MANVCFVFVSSCVSVWIKALWSNKFSCMHMCTHHNHYLLWTSTHFTRDWAKIIVCAVNGALHASPTYVNYSRTRVDTRKRWHLVGPTVQGTRYEIANIVQWRSLLTYAGSRWPHPNDCMHGVGHLARPVAMLSVLGRLFLMWRLPCSWSFPSVPPWYNYKAKGSRRKWDVCWLTETVR